MTASTLPEATSVTAMSATACKPTGKLAQVKQQDSQHTYIHVHTATIDNRHLDVQGIR